METPEVIAPTIVGDYEVEVCFKDGVVGRVNFAADLDIPIYMPLRDPAYFARAYVDAHTIVWPNGADIAPETLYDLARGEEPGAWWARALAEPVARKVRKKRSATA